MMDWCFKGQCELCPGKFQRFYFGQSGTGRKKTVGVVMLDEWRECDHKCHKVRK